MLNRMVQDSLNSQGINKISLKRKPKWAKKKDEQEPEFKPQSVEMIMNRILQLPKILLNDMPIFKHEASSFPLHELLSVSCSHENILVYSRYIKKSRKHS